MSEFAPQALRMLADVVQRPALPAAEFPRVKASFLRNMAVGRSRARFPAENALVHAMFPEGHPYARAFPEDRAHTTKPRS